MGLEAIHGIGVKGIENLEKMNIYSIYDLLEYYPYKYNIYKPTNFLDINEKDDIVINVIVESIPKVIFIKKNFNRMSFRALTSNRIISVTLFNRAFMKKFLQVGKEVTIKGKYDAKKNVFTASTLLTNSVKDIKIDPVYHQIKGIKSSVFSNYIKSALEEKVTLNDYVPTIYNGKYHFLTKEEAVREIHEPTTIERLKQARLKLIYEEMFLFMYKMFLLKEKRRTTDSFFQRKLDFSKIEAFIKNLPFLLTEDQRKAVEEGLNDFASKKRMNRLVLGDVGSGKTIVGTILMVANSFSGYQSALMAPTEILASQHYENIKSLLEPLGIHVSLLIGSLKKSEKKKIIEDLKEGNIDILIGTHALISKDITFKNLGLVITDEQHRFGVNQRNNLQNKGRKPDVLYMSATPIPRTYALTLYGDMDTSLIKSKPNGRKVIETKIKTEKELREVLLHILEEIKKGHQIYVVAPLIEEEEQSSLRTVEELKEKFDEAFQGRVKIDILHGKQKKQEQEKIMQSFSSNETKILIATTVVEVGVDVRNATMMVIFNAERFGLATLHQLRGRVGRNEEQCYCYLISDYDTPRLKVLEESNDGFYISEQDYKMRREGDLFGEKQSGDMNFKIADLKRDIKIVMQAKKDVEEYFSQKDVSSDLLYENIKEDLDFVD